LELLRNLDAIGEGGEMDLSPLRNDQRVSGKIYGDNPLQSMFDLVRAYAYRYEEQSFRIKWGGGRVEMEGKGFVMYVEDVPLSLQRLRSLAADRGVPIEANHKFGIRDYGRFVQVDERLRSEVNDPEGFREFLKGLEWYSHSSPFSL